MVRNWDKYVGTEKLSKRVYKGIPHGMRGDVWRILLEVHQYMENLPNVYQEMKTRAHSHSTDIRQIDLDVNRTYRDHVMFRTRYSIKQQQLFHVLAAYSMYNTEVGYCQGMSQIAALLLMYMSEEEAFWALHSLLYGERHKMHGFFIPGFPKLMRFQSHHDHILKKYMPKLKKHLDENEVFASLYTMKWFFQCFLDRSPFSLTLRLWDIYVLEGEKLLTTMSFATLKMHKAYIKSQDMDGIVGFLQEELVKDFGAGDDDVVEHLKSCMNELKRGNMDHPPAPSEDEKPKLPFGTEFIPNTERVSGSVIPEFAKHSGYTDTFLPEVKRRTSQKKKREKVKRGKSKVGKNAIVANGSEHHDVVPTVSVKPSKSFNDPLAVSRSPFLRRSKKPGKTERHKDEQTKQQTNVDNKATKKKANDENKKKTKETNKNKQHMEDKEQDLNNETEQKDSKHKNKNENKETDTHKRTNGSDVKRKAIDKLTLSNNHTDTDNSNPQKHSDNDISLLSDNNSNNFKATNGHRNSGSYNNHDRHMKPFVPPILAHKVSSSGESRLSPDDKSSVELNTSQPRTNEKVVPKWIPPSPEKKERQGVKSVNKHNSGVHFDDVSDGVFDTDSESKSSHNVKMRQKPSYLRSQSSDIFNQFSDTDMKAKTPSFTQLTPVINSLENVHMVYRGSGSPSDSSSHTTSPRHNDQEWNRPQSFYDNVPYPYHPSEYPEVPVIPESPVSGSSSFDHIHGGNGRMEHTSDKKHSKTKSRSSVDMQGKVPPVPRSRSTANKTSQNRIRPDSTGLTVNDQKMSNSKSMDNLKEWREKDKRWKKRNKISMATSQSSANFHTVARISSPKTHDYEDDVFGHSSSPSPFQKAVVATGILNSPKSPLKGRRMSREEIVTAAVLSQMEAKAAKSRKQHRKARKVNAISESTMNGYETGSKTMKSAQMNNNNGSNETTRLATKVAPYRPAILMKSPQKKSHKSNNRALNIKAEKAWKTSEIDIISDEHLQQIQSRRSFSAEHLDNISSPQEHNVTLRSFPSLHAMPYQKQSTDVNGVAFYSRHPISNSATHDNNMIQISNFPVARYDASPTGEKWINITRYSPEHSPQPSKNDYNRSPGLSKTSKADINELLSAGINADPNLINRYEMSSKHSTVSAVYPKTHSHTVSRTKAYRPNDNTSNRRRSVNTGVQTDESRLL
uniref:uncharacterized protein LOC120336917 isoform X1 n=1 Tax=Styela clava TaxID=7725 RepID=UPI001939A4FF|nr:uncharacterized protein LOC120336917 isoform X1 [Styela clava]